MAVYYILAKQVLRTYPPLLVTTWAYLIGEVTELARPFIILL